MKSNALQSTMTLANLKQQQEPYLKHTDRKWPLFTRTTHVFASVAERPNRPSSSCFTPWSMSDIGRSSAYLRNKLAIIRNNQTEQSMALKVLCAMAAQKDTHAFCGVLEAPLPVGACRSHCRSLALARVSCPVHGRASSNIAHNINTYTLDNGKARRTTRYSCHGSSSK